MSKQPCQDCYIKNLIIESLQREVQRLRAQIAEARGAAIQIQSEAEGILAHNQPRGRWAFFKGRKDAALRVIRFLR